MHTFLCSITTPTTEPELHRYSPRFIQYSNHKALCPTSTTITHSPGPNQYYNHTQSWVQPVLKPYSPGPNQYSNHTILGSTSTPCTQSWVPPVLQPRGSGFNQYSYLNGWEIEPKTFGLVSQCVATVPYPLKLASTK